MPDSKKIMVKLAWEAMQRAHAPYSKFQVGACVEADDGELYYGANIENASYGLTVCAERVAIFSMVAAGKKRIRSLAVVGATDGACFPCGACRQVMREFASPEIPIYMGNRRGEIVTTMALGELLPQSFGPEFLNDK